MLHSGYCQEYVAVLLYFMNILQKRYLKREQASMKASKHMCKVNSYQEIYSDYNTRDVHTFIFCNILDVI